VAARKKYEKEQERLREAEEEERAKVSWPTICSLSRFATYI
jgi:hypothetical protein